MASDQRSNYAQPAWFQELVNAGFSVLNAIEEGDLLSPSAQRLNNALAMIPQPWSDWGHPPPTCTHGLPCSEPASLVREDCRVCNGTGGVTAPCSRCDGRGYFDKPATPKPLEFRMSEGDRKEFEAMAEECRESPRCCQPYAAGGWHSDDCLSRPRRARVVRFDLDDRTVTFRYETEREVREIVTSAVEPSLSSGGGAK